MAHTSKEKEMGKVGEIKDKNQDKKTHKTHFDCILKKAAMACFLFLVIAFGFVIHTGLTRAKMKTTENVNLPKYKQVNISNDNHQNGNQETLKPASTTETEHTAQESLLITNGTFGLDWMTEGEVEFENCSIVQQGRKCRFEFSPGDRILPGSHAVLFKPFRVRKNKTLPKYHPPEQKWVFYETESPARTWNKYKREMDIWSEMNITLTYQSDADITFALWAINCSFNQSKVIPSINYAKQKDKGVLWIVSNCRGSGRNEYVAELQKYIPVDIFGKCGKGPICGKYGSNFTCELDFINKYKFYLAFENSYCEEYYTEKVLKPLKAKTVPVVMGHTNYTELLAPKTFINVRDFKSPEHLAEYLLYLDKNDGAFNQYIDHIQRLKCTHLFKPSLACALCRYLHLHRGEKRRAPDMKTYWGVQRRCVKPRTYFQGIADVIIPKLPRDERYE